MALVSARTLRKLRRDLAQLQRDYETRGQVCVDMSNEASRLMNEAADLRCAITLARNEPVPMRLNCPECGELHIDEGAFATKPHHTHACQACGNVWRPAVRNTVGVRFLPGFKNEAPDPDRFVNGIARTFQAVAADPPTFALATKRDPVLAAGMVYPHDGSAPKVS
jgi:predicted RNA-binding Zn-ribbon protein involved in translation (DUF1610 family)